jgi:ATP-dependent helicase HrpB
VPPKSAAPRETAWAAAAQLLERLGAINDDGRLTSAGREMARLPLHPRLSAMILEADRRGAGIEACRAAAVLSAGERLPAGPARHHGPSDVLALLEQEWSPGARRVFDHIRRLARVRSGGAGDDALLPALLKAFPDRVARRRAGNALLLAGGGSAALSESSVVNRDWMVAVDIEERLERGAPLVRLASGIEPDWLLDLFPERVTETSGVEWNRAAERVEPVSRLLFDGLTIDETRGGAADPAEAARLLTRKAIEAGIEKFIDRDEIDNLVCRIGFASRFTDLPASRERALEEAVESICQGLRGFAELQQAASRGGVLRALENRFSPEQRRLIEQLAPPKIRLRRGREVKVHYSGEKPPWAASRIQDFFGMRESPRVGGGTTPVVLHLLAPNQRPVQTTDDLAGFWVRLYPQVRRELARRYPKHRWPENPLAD